MAAKQRFRIGSLPMMLGFALIVLSGRPILAASTGQLELTVVDKDTGRPIACRMHLIGPNKKPRKPDKVPYWHDHFVLPGKIVLRLPVGNYSFVIERGPEYLDQKGRFTINHFADDAKQIDLRRFIDMAADGWWSGDLDVRRPVRDIELLMEADDLHVAEVITWQNGDSPDSRINENGSAPSKAKKPVLVCFDANRCYQQMAGIASWSGTELLLFHLPEPLKLSHAESGSPPIVETLKKLRNQGDFWVDLSKPYWWDLPMLAAAGQVDSIEVAHNHLCRDTVIDNEADGRPRDRARYPDVWGNAQWSQDIYFRLLECGLRIPPTAGSGSGASPNPVGYNRVYAHIDGPFSYAKWWESVRAGRVFVTNGPLLKPLVHGELPGHVFRAGENEKLDFEIGLSLSTREPISYLEIVKDGKVEHSIPFAEYAKSGKLPKLEFDRSGWFLIRATTDLPKTYRFAMTGPYYVEIGEQPRISRSAAQFFLDWVFERARQIKQSGGEQGREALRWQRKARDFWQEMVDKANAE